MTAKNRAPKLDLSHVLDPAFEFIIAVSGAERGMVRVCDGEGNVLFEKTRNISSRDNGHSEAARCRAIIEKLQPNGRSHFLSKTHEHPPHDHNSCPQEHDGQAFICLPFRQNGTVFGGVYLDKSVETGAFGQNSRSLVALIVDFITLTVSNVLKEAQHRGPPDATERELREKYALGSIVGRHPRIVQMLRLVTQVAQTDATVLILGESGTGKEVVARAIHGNSLRRTEPFIAINCGALAENLLESELFGHVRGAFTGAISNKPGWFECADGGTIFLDEVSEMTPALQVKLLRVLQTGEYSPVGSRKIQKCAVRVLAATNKNLEWMISEGSFREDLYYRLNVIDVEIPPLRERKIDVSLLALHFLKLTEARLGRRDLQFSSEAEEVLLSYDYPGNVRELENAVERAVTLAEGGLIEAHHLPPRMARRDNSALHLAPEFTLTEAKRRASDGAEREVIVHCLTATQGHITNAARQAGVDVSNFHKVMRKHQIDPGSFKNNGHGMV